MKNKEVSMKRILLLLYMFFLSAAVWASAPESFPIVADIMHTNLYDRTRFADIRKAGFNACLCWCNSVEEIRRTLDTAKEFDLKLIIFSRVILDTPQKVVPAIKNHESLWQYYLADEPYMDRLKELRETQRRIRIHDSNAKCYINLLPNTGKDLLERIGVNTYAQYLQAFSNISQPQISYDFYPIHRDVVRDDIWYPILDDVRKESLRTGRPFWAYILSVPHFIYPKPTMAHLRLQCYVNLAYGAQGLQYFSYSTPEKTGDYDFHDGPLLRNGKLSATYTLVKDMNATLRNVASLFYRSTITSVEHQDCNNGSVVVSHFVKNKKKYTCYVNKSPFYSVVVDIDANKYAHRITKSLSTATVKSKYLIYAGDILILQDK